LWGLWERHFEKPGRRLVSLTEQFDTGLPSGRAMMGMLGVMAQYERELLGERVSAALRRSAEKGRYHCNRWQAPYGYRRAGVATLEPDPERAPTVRLIYEWYVEGIGCSRICARLRELRISGPGGARWWPQTVRRIVAAPVYAGVVGGNNQAHQALVPHEMWDRAQVQAKFRGGGWKPLPGRHDFLLSGLLRCVRCGGRMAGTYYYYSGRRVPAYCCQETAAQGGQCRGQHVVALPLEAAVVQALDDAGRRGGVAGVTWDAAPTAAGSDERDAVRAELDALPGRKERLLDMVERGYLGADAIAERLAALDAEGAALRGRLAERAPRELPKPAVLRRRFKGIGSALTSQRPLAERKALLAAAVVRIVAEDRRRVRLVLRIP